MKKIGMIVGVLAMSSWALAKDVQESARIEFNIKVNQVYQLGADKTYSSSVASSVSNLRISGTSEDGQSLDYASGDIATTGSSNSQIKIIDEQTIEMLDLKTGKSHRLEASISDKEISVSSEQMKLALEDSMQKQGQSLVTSMRLESADSKAEYNLQVSAMNCQKGDKKLSCELSAGLVLSIVKIQ